MSHVGMVPTGENPSAGSSQRKPPAVRIDESAVVPGIRFRPVRIASRRTRSGSKGAHLLERTTGIEPVTSILARSRSDGSPAQRASKRRSPRHCGYRLNYVRKLQCWQPMRVLPHLPGPMPDSEHRSCPARRHTGRQRLSTFPNC